MQQRPQHWLIYLSLILLIVSCGEPVPVDCTPDEEQCTTETEGGFETGPLAGIAAGGAAVVAIAAGGLGGGPAGRTQQLAQILLLVALRVEPVCRLLLLLFLLLDCSSKVCWSIRLTVLSLVCYG